MYAMHAHRDEELSEPAEVDLCALFPKQQVQMLEERTLSGNQPKAGARRLKWLTSDSGSEEDGVARAVERHEPLRHQQHGSSLKCGTTTTVTLNPMEIRTFYMQLA